MDIHNEINKAELRAIIRGIDQAHKAASCSTCLHFITLVKELREAELKELETQKITLKQL